MWRMEQGTILVVDDEPNIADLVELYLAREGYRVLKAATGEAGLDAVRDHRPRLVVLDVGLPDIDGLEVCKRLRQTSQIPVIFLTARDGEVDRVLGLELGGDDYLTKPFSPAELVARVKAVLRRVDGGPAPEVVQAGDVTIDTGRREVRVDDEPRRVHHQGVRPAPLPRRAARASRCPASRSSTACGATTGSATPAPSTCTSRRCARSSATRPPSPRCAGVGYRLESEHVRTTRPPRRRLRTRLLVAMVAIALGTLVVTALVTAGLAAHHRRRQRARRPRRRTARSSPPSSTSSSRDSRRRVATEVAGRAPADPAHPQARQDHAARVGRRGDRDRRRRHGPARCSGCCSAPKAGRSHCPNGVAVDDLDIAALRAGETQDGRDGDIVFTAPPADRDR